MENTKGGGQAEALTFRQVWKMLSRLEDWTPGMLFNGWTHKATGIYFYPDCHAIFLYGPNGGKVYRSNIFAWTLFHFPCAKFQRASDALALASIRTPITQGEPK